MFDWLQITLRHSSSLRDPDPEIAICFHCLNMSPFTAAQNLGKPAVQQFALYAGLDRGSFVRYAKRSSHFCGVRVVFNSYTKFVL